MATNVAELGIRVDANGAVTTVRNLGQELDKTAQASERLTSTTKRQDEELRKLAEISRSLGDLQGQQFQSLIKLNGGQERFLQIQKQIDEELRQSDALMAQTVTTTNKAAEATDRHGVSIRSLRSPLSTLTANLSGVNPQIAQLAGLFSSIGLGSTITVGVIAGLGAISYAYDKLTEDTRKAREEQDKFVESLAKARDQATQNSPEGRGDDVERAKKAYEARQKELKNILAAGTGRNLNPEDAGSIGLQTDPAERQKKVEEATKAVRQAFIDLQAAEADQARAHFAAANASYELEKSLDAQLKDIDDKRAARAAKELEQLKKKVDILDKIKIDFGGNQGALDNIGQNFNIGNFGGVPLTGTFDKNNVPPQIPDEELKKFFEEFNKGRSGRRDEGLKEEQDAIHKSAKAAIEHSEALTKAAQVVGQAVEYYIVQRVGGGGAGANIGASVAKGAFTDAAANGIFGTSFASTALGAAVFAPLVAGVGAAAGGLLDFVTGLGNAKEELRQMQEQAHQAALTARIDAQGFTTLEQALEQIDIEERKRLQAIQDAGYGQEELDARRKQAYEDASEKRRRTEEAYAERARFANEDLEVRRLRATGHSKEADALDLKNRQEAEIAAARAQGMTDEYIARLKEVQAIEKTTAALAKMNSFLNVPPGFKYNSLIFQNSPARDYNPQFPIDIPYTPTPPSGFPTSSSKFTLDVPVVVNLDGQVLTVVVHKNLKAKAQKQFGDSARWGEVN